MRSDGKIYLLTSYPPGGLDHVQAFTNLRKVEQCMRGGTREPAHAAASEENQ